MQPGLDIVPLHLVTLSDASTLFLLSLAGSAHCAGMCGGFALAASSPSLRGGLWARLAGHHLGKTFSYLAVATMILMVLEKAWAAGLIDRVRDGLGMVLAISLGGVGLAQVSQWRWQAPWERRLNSGHGGCAMARLGRPSFMRAVGLGWLNGLLPCGLSLSAMLLALRYRDFGDLFLSLALFGLGTLPVLAATVFLGSRVSPSLRARLSRISGWLLLVLAAFTFLRSTEIGRAWLHGAFSWLPGAAADPWCR